MGGKDKVVILCGGLGTRLREETEFKPKPMVEIGGMPILWHILKTYSHFGYNDFVLCLGYKGEHIKQYFLNHELMSQDFTLGLRGGKKTIHQSQGSVEDWNITFAETGLNTLTGGRVKRIEKYVDSDRFMLTYGDGVADIDIRALVSFHRRMGTVGTLTCVNQPSRFGMVKMDAGGKVTEFVEKPVLHGDMINAGFYVFEKTFFDCLQDSEGCVLERAPLERLSSEGKLAAYKHAGFWQCMDTYRDYLDLNGIWDSGKAKWKVW